MAGDGFRELGRRSVGRAAFLGLERWHLIAPDGEHVVRAAVRHPGAVAVVPLDGDEVVLIEQYRAPVRRTLLEIPAGKFDVPGEPVLDTAHRELAEEVGLRASRMEHLITIHTTPGFSDEEIVIYLATGLDEVATAPHGPEERSSSVVRMPLGAALDMIAAGTITDAKTIAGLHAAGR